MKSILVLALLSVVLTVSFGSAYGYEGKIKITGGNLGNLITGDKFSIEGIIVSEDVSKIF